MPFPTWYAAYTYPQHEAKVAAQLCTSGLQNFLPTYSVVRRWRNRQTVCQRRPLFPGYLFVRVGRKDTVRVLRTPGVVCLVGTGGQPTPIPDSEIDFLQSHALYDKAEPHPFINVGDKVRITFGPFAGLEGFLVKKQSQCRLVVCVELLRQAVSVQIDSDRIEFVARRQNSAS